MTDEVERTNTKIQIPPKNVMTIFLAGEYEATNADGKAKQINQLQRKKTNRKNWIHTSRCVKPTKPGGVDNQAVDDTNATVCNQLGSCSRV